MNCRRSNHLGLASFYIKAKLFPGSVRPAACTVSIMTSSFSRDSFSSDMSVGNRMFCGAQVASRIKVPLFRAKLRLAQFSPLPDHSRCLLRAGPLVDLHFSHKQSIEKPRVRSKSGSELPLSSLAWFQAEDALSLYGFDGFIARRYISSHPSSTFKC